ncbi:hypothetical protein GDO86_011370 [Hymenochirus boettgeri]|uniref:Uncharacterized protein n=1 Tax=Hymenochirus boettgeri TaxID=247094 RepID=A0A8T2JIV0_9PIPI|nr:hypothetical protein GDO86_011370 [Hymenochirus boettgeri]
MATLQQSVPCYLNNYSIYCITIVQFYSYKYLEKKKHGKLSNINIFLTHFINKTLKTTKNIFLKMFFTKYVIKINYVLLYKCC